MCNRAYLRKIIINRNRLRIAVIADIRAERIRHRTNRHIGRAVVDKRLDRFTVGVCHVDCFGVEFHIDAGRDGDRLAIGVCRIGCGQEQGKHQDDCGDSLFHSGTSLY